MNITFWLVKTQYNSSSTFQLLSMSPDQQQFLQIHFCTAQSTICFPSILRINTADRREYHSKWFPLTVNINLWLILERINPLNIVSNTFWWKGLLKSSSSSSSSTYTCLFVRQSKRKRRERIDRWKQILHKKRLHSCMTSIWWYMKEEIGSAHFFYVIMFIESLQVSIDYEEQY
jgi:hypothetical protein